MIESRQVILSAVPHLDMDRKQRSKFRPCIDLHNGQVKQIVGGTLSDDDPSSLKTNFVARCVPPISSQSIGPSACWRLLDSESPDYYARLYKKHGLEGGHVIKLGKGNDEAAKDALGAWPGGLQIGGGITEANAQGWLDAGASKVRAWMGQLSIPRPSFPQELTDRLS